MDSDARLAAKIGAAIASARHERGWSQDDLAERLQLSKNHIGFLERGDRLPSVGVLVRIARGLGLSLDEILLDRASDRDSGAEVTALVSSIHPDLRQLVIAFLRGAAEQPEPADKAKSGRRRRQR